MKFLVSTFLLTSLAWAMPFAGNADDTSASWDRKTLSLAFTGNGVKKSVRNKPFRGEVIYTNATEQSGNVAFVCLRNTLTANVALGPTNYGEVIEEWIHTRRARTWKPSLTINGEEIKSSMWTYVPKLKLVVPRKKVVAKKLYNAAIRGDEVVFDTDHMKPLTLILPKPNATFADFGAACDMGRKKA